MVPVNWLLERSRFHNLVKLPISTGIAPTSYIATNSIIEHELLQYEARHCAAARWEGRELLHNYSSSHAVTKFQKVKKTPHLRGWIHDTRLHIHSLEITLHAILRLLYTN